MKGLVLALGFLTRLPVPRLVATGEDYAAAIRWYPVVGLVVGVLIVAAGLAGSAIDLWVGAGAALTAWVLVTGALHLDGLADVADGMGAAHGDPRRLLAVMADPHVGSFGVVAIALQLIVKLILLHTVLAGPSWPLALVPLAARVGPLVWARWLPPLGSGLGAAAARAVRARDVAAGVVLLAVAGAVSPPILVAVPLIAGWGWWLKRRLGGINGDGHGAGVELVETGLLLALAAVRAL